jgi:hypothetical protein
LTHTIAEDVFFLRRLSPQLKMFKDRGKNHFGFRCPYCGDSRKNQFAARGSAFPSPNGNSLIIGCFNCNMPKINLLKFLEDQDNSLAKEYRIKRFKGKIRTDEFESLVDPIVEPEIENDLPNLLGLGQVFPVSLSSTSMNYLKGRFIEKMDDIYFTKNTLEIIEKFRPETKKLELFKDKAAIVFPLMTIEKHVYGVQLRFLEGDFRYLTIMIDRRFAKVYGLHEVDINKDIWVTEGIFDAKMFDNNLANLDAALYSVSEKTKLPKEKFILVFDNENRNSDVMKSMKKGISMGYRVFFWPKNSKEFGKDLNEIRGNSPEYFKNLIDNRYSFVSSGLSADLKMKEFLKN